MLSQKRARAHTNPEMGRVKNTNFEKSDRQEYWDWDQLTPSSSRP
jgi:hypothetical protein